MSQTHTKQTYDIPILGKSVSQRCLIGNGSSSTYEDTELCEHLLLDAAVAIFLSARRPHCRYPLAAITEVENWIYFDTSSELENPLTASHISNLKGANITRVGGWLVEGFFEQKELFSFTPHCWNVDYTGQHFDTRPLSDRTKAYVLDVDLYEYAQLNNLVIENSSHWLWLDNGRFSILGTTEQIPSKELPELRTEFLFR